MIKISLYQPDIPQNLGAILRLAACFAIDVDIIEPCGFPLDHKKIRRAGMDYIDYVNYRSHDSWNDFTNWHQKQKNKPRLILLSTKGAKDYTNVSYQPEDILLLGRESAGAPPEVHDYADEIVRIPMRQELRSLNIAMATGIVASEAIRQINLKKGKTIKS